MNISRRSALQRTAVLAFFGILVSSLASEEQPLTSTSYATVYLVDRAKGEATAFPSVQPGAIRLPQLGLTPFADMTPSALARRIKDVFVSRGLYPSDTFQVIIDPADDQFSVQRSGTFRFPKNSDFKSFLPQLHRVRQSPPSDAPKTKNRNA